MCVPLLINTLLHIIVNATTATMIVSAALPRLIYLDKYRSQSIYVVILTQCR